jgi:polyhydroxyalkanoate synthesis regulator phasin
MYKFFGSIIVIAIFIGAFHYYTQSGEVLDEEAPVISENTSAPETAIDPNKPLLQADKMNKMIPDEPEKEPELPSDTQKKIDEMVEKGKMTLMTEEEKRAMNEEAVTMMETSEESDSSAEVKMLSQEEMEAQFVSRQGTFNEIDLIHKGSGLALIYPETAEGPILRLQDFNVTRGPDLHVYLSRNENITSSDQLGSYHDLGLLKSSKGNQNYQLPSNHEGFKSVVIWCKAFGVLFSSATLQP